MRNIKSYIKKKISDKFSKNVFLKPKWLGQSLTFSTDKLKKEKEKKKGIGHNSSHSTSID